MTDPIVQALDPQYAQNRLYRFLQELTDEELFVQPASTAPPIAWHIWHIARYADMFQSIFSDREQVWECDNLVEAYGLDVAKLGLLQAGVQQTPQHALEGLITIFYRIGKYKISGFALQQECSDTMYEHTQRTHRLMAKRKRKPPINQQLVARPTPFILEAKSLERGAYERGYKKGWQELMSVSKQYLEPLNGLYTVLSATSSGIVYTALVGEGVLALNALEPLVKKLWTVLRDIDNAIKIIEHALPGSIIATDITAHGQLYDMANKAVIQQDLRLLSDWVATQDTDFGELAAAKVALRPGKPPSEVNDVLCDLVGEARSQGKKGMEVYLHVNTALMDKDLSGEFTPVEGDAYTKLQNMVEGHNGEQKASSYLSNLFKKRQSKVTKWLE